MREIGLLGRLLPTVATALLTLALVVQSLPTKVGPACHDEITNAENGTLQPVVDGDASLNYCTWSVGAPPGHKLLIDVDQVSLGPGSILTVSVDGVTRHNFSGQCDACLMTHLVGELLLVSYNRTDAVEAHATSEMTSNAMVIANSSLEVPLSHIPVTSQPSVLLPSSSPSTSGKQETPFSISYLSFDPIRCPPARPAGNGRVVGKERHLGSVISFRCNPPFVKVTSAERMPANEGNVEAICKTLPESPVPAWSAGPPSCAIPECGKNPILLSVGIGEAENAVVLVQPGYSGAPKSPKIKQCVWEVSTGRKKHLVVDVELADFTSNSALELYDGRVSSGRLLNGPDGRLTSGESYITVTGKLVVVLHYGSANEATDDNNRSPGFHVESGHGFRVRVTARKPPCGTPVAPDNGDVRGSMLTRAPVPINAAAHMEVIYSCNLGFQLTGAPASSRCVESSGEFDSAAPVCVTLPLSVPYNNSSVTDVVATVTIQREEVDVKFHNVSNVESPLKSIKPRTFKDRRPNAQSTEEKTNVKASKGDGTKQSSSQGTAVDSSAKDENVEKGLHSVPSQPHSEYDDNYAYPPEEEEGDGISGGDSFVDDGGMVGVDDEVGGAEEEPTTFPTVAVALGVTLPLLLITLAIAGGVAYRKLYPVRMNMGRKFDTFENPVYNRSKRDPNTTGTLLPGGSLESPPRPAEMQRLMANNQR